MHKQNYKLIIISLILTFFCCLIKIQVTPSWFNGTLERNHYLLMSFMYTNNEQSRLLQFIIPNTFFRVFNLSIPYSYLAQRFLFQFLTFICFYKFNEEWLSKKQNILSLISLALLTAASFKNHLQESATLLSLCFLLVLWSIRTKKDYLFIIFLFIGSLNNETILFTPCVYFIVNVKNANWNHILPLALKTILLSMPAILATGVIRWITRDNPHLGGAFHLFHNLTDIYQPLVLLNIFWLIPFTYFNRLPDYFKRCLIAIPFFIIPHLITGIISETRQMIPLCFVLLPASLMHLSKFEDKL